MIDLNLNIPQYQAVTSDARLILFIGGLGSGKSTVGGLWTRDRIDLPGSFGLILASTKEQMRDSTLPRVLEGWERCGVVEGDHYVIGRRPPRHWGIKPWHPSNNTNIITFAWGAYAKTGSVENYNSHRGPEIDWCFGDEWRDWKEKALPVLVGRLRGQASKRAGRKQQMMLGTTPPDDPDFVRKYFDMDDVQVIRSTTFDNEANLDPGYIDLQRSLLDELTFRREVLGELIRIAGAQAYYKYDESAHTDRRFDPNADVYLAFDFNVGHKPMSLIVVQREGRQSFAVKEFVLKYSNTERTIKAAAHWLKDQGFGQTQTVYITGDYAGNRNESNASHTDYQIIQQVLTEFKFKHKPPKTKPTRRKKDRVGNMNWLIQNIQGERRFFVNPDTCPELNKDLLDVQWDASGEDLDDSNPERTHPSDAASYYAYNFEPNTRKQSRVGIA